MDVAGQGVVDMKETSDVKRKNGYYWLIEKDGSKYIVMIEKNEVLFFGDEIYYSYNHKRFLDCKWYGPIRQAIIKQ